MKIPLLTYVLLLCGVVCESFGSSFLAKSNGMTRLLPFVISICFYLGSFVFGSYILRVMPMGILYALWAGVGIVSVSLVGAIFNKQMLDTPALIGMALIITGVCVIYRYSGSTAS